jgi:hypothetical protein
MKKYILTQNNSGGFYELPEWTGPSELGGVCAYYGWQDQPVDVWVMAGDSWEAEGLAQKYAGVYFNGVEKGRDCDCCGDRWYSAEEWDEEMR